LYLCICEKKELTEKCQFDVFHYAFIIMVCTVSSDWIKLAGQSLDRDFYHIIVANLYPMCMYRLHNSVMCLIIQKKERIFCLHTVCCGPVISQKYF